MSTVLRRKLRRDLRRQWPQFTAVAVVVAIAIAVYVAASDAAANLAGSFDRAYARQRLPDVVLVGPDVDSLAGEARALPGAPAVDARRQADIGARIGSHSLLARIISVPDDGTQPAVASLAVRSGSLPSGNGVLVEEHLADYFDLVPGMMLELWGTGGGQRVTVTGTGLSTEYFWPARSRQETMTTPAQFGVVYAPRAVVDALAPDAGKQLALYATDRTNAAALVAAATDLAGAHGLTVVTRTEQPSYLALDQDVATFSDFADLLPLAFLVAGALGAYILLSRLVHAQRAVIGTLAANGVSPRALRRHYIGYGLAAGGLAIVPGVGAGIVLGRWFTGLYTDAIGLPLHVNDLHPTTMLAAAATGLAATALAAWGPARAAARLAPGEAMRISPSGRSGTSRLERLLPPARRLPARWRMVLRGLARNRRRTTLTVTGVALSLALVVVFAGLRDSVWSVIDRQFTAVDLSDGQLTAADADAARRLLTAVRADPAVAVAEPTSRADVTLTAGDHRYDTLLIGLPAATGLHVFTDRSGRRLALDPAGGVLVGDGLRRTLGLRLGDAVTVTVPATGARFSEPVTGFLDEAIAAVAYVAIEHLATAPTVPGPDAVLVQLRAGADRAAAGDRLSQLPGALAYADNDAVEATIRDAFAIMDVLLGVMLAFAVVLATALLFNAMSANVAERSVELGTLRAAGMGRRLVARLVATENLLLTMAAIPLGLGAGTLAARAFMGRYENLGYRWTLDIAPTTYLVILVGLFVGAGIAQLPVRRAVTRLDIARIVRERSP